MLVGCAADGRRNGANATPSAPRTSLRSILSIIEPSIASSNASASPASIGPSMPSRR